MQMVKGDYDSLIALFKKCNNICYFWQNDCGFCNVCRSY